MDVDGSDWSIMSIQLALHEILIARIALIDTEIFRAYVECLLFTLCEVQAMCADWLSAITTTYRGLGHRFRRRFIIHQHLLRSLQDIAFLRIRKYFRLPFAHLTIITDTDNVMRVLIPDNRKTVDWVLVPIGS